MSHELKGERRGMAFADGLFALVRNYGPEDLSPSEQDVLAGYLLDNAVEWARAKNRTGIAIASQEQGGSDHE